MQFITISLVLAALGAGAAACTCSHNNDAGRWIDKNFSPAGVANILINSNGGCYTATTQGIMCVSFNKGNQAVKDCLADEAEKDQSYHGDWFLWTSITCTDGSASGSISITAR